MAILVHHVPLLESIVVTHSKPRIIFHKIESTSHILNNITLFSYSADVQTNSGGLTGLNSFPNCSTMDILIVLPFLVLKWLKINRNMLKKSNNFFYLPYSKVIIHRFIRAAVGLRCRLETFASEFPLLLNFKQLQWIFWASPGSSGRGNTAVSDFCSNQWQSIGRIHLKVFFLPSIITKAVSLKHSHKTVESGITKSLQSVYLINPLLLHTLLHLLFSLSAILTFQSVRINKRHFLFY